MHLVLGIKERVVVKTSKGSKPTNSLYSLTMDIDVSTLLCLSEAASEGNVDLVSSILEQIEADRYFYIEKKYHPSVHTVVPPLLAACRAGQLEVVRILVEKIRSSNWQWSLSRCIELEEHYFWTYNETPLSAAAEIGYVDIMKLLLEEYLVYHGKHGKEVGSTHALVLACKKGHSNISRLLIQHGAEVNGFLQGAREIPLAAAAEEGHAECVRVLLENGADVDKLAKVSIESGRSRRWVKDTPLLIAVRAGHTDCIKLLLEKGADIDKKSDSGTPLQLAVTNGDFDYVQLMLEYNKANIKAVPYSVLLQACKEGHMGCFRLLIDYGIWNVNGEACDKTISSSCSSKYPFGMPPLLAACQAGQLEVTRALLNFKGIQINFVFEKETPLSAAIRGGYNEIVKLLIEHNVDVNYVGDGEQGVQSPLYAAMYNGNYKLVLLLLKNVAVNLGVSSTCETPIMVAAQNGHVNILKLLLLKGAEIHSRNPRTMPSALTRACKGGHTECARLLIQHGGNVNEDSEEGTPLTCATENGHTECTRLLLENGADFNKKNILNYTPLMLASQNDHVEDTKLLLEHGANVNEKSYGESALTLAIRNYCEPTAKLLMQYGAVKEDSDKPSTQSEYFNTDDSSEESESESEYHDESESTHEENGVQDREKTNPESAKLLAAVEKAMQEKGILKHTLAHGVLAGPARSGKSSLMKRLTGEMPDSTSSSTGVAEQVVQVGVKQSYSVALGVYDSIWFKLLYDEEAIRLITLASHATPPPPPQPHASLKVTNSSISAVTIPFQSGADLIVIPTHEEQEGTVSMATNIPAASLFPTGYIAPMGVFKNAIQRRDLEDLQELFENSWSLYLTDTGGQIEFQELLPLLVSGPSIFFLTFCLHQDLNKRFMIEYHLPDGGRSEPYQSTLTVMEAILQTLASIASMGTFTYKGPEKDTIQIKPKVFVVGTHKDLLDQDKVDTEIQRIDQHIQTAIKSTSHYREDLVEFASKSQLIFTVNNLSEDVTDFVVIRAAVERVVYRSKFEISFPSNWLIFSLVLRQEMIKDSVISYDQCFAIAQDCGLTDDEELNHALQFLHTKIGLVRHFPIPDLRDIIIRYPQILFDMVTKLIVNTFTFENVCHRKLTEFEKKGIFTTEDLALIEKFSVPLLPLEKLLKLLEHLRIVAPFQEDGKKKYFIPCVLAHAIESQSQSPSLTSDIPPLLITFKCGYCPKGVPGVLIKYLITNEMGSKFEWELMTDQIFKDQVSFCVSPYDTITLKIHPMYLELTHSAMSKLRNQEVRNVCNNVRLSIEKGITKVSSDMNLTSHAKHSLTFYCQNSECSQSKPHPATKICRNEDGSFCNLWCKNSGKILQSPLPDGYSVWFRKERGGHDAIPSGSLSLPRLDVTMATAEHEVKDTEKRFQDLTISDTHGQPMIARREVIPVVKWNLKTLHSKGVIGSGVVIAILDGGVYVDHDNIDGSKIYHPPNSTDPYCSFNYIQSQQQLFTQHGTAVAAVTGCLLCNDKSQAGIAPGAQLVVCRVSDDKDCYYVDAICQALTQLRDLKRSGQPLDIICMSFRIDCSEDIEELLSDLAHEKIVLVAAAGNDGSAQHGAYFPASDSNVLSIGALTPGARKSDVTPDSGVDVYAYGEDIVVPKISVTKNELHLEDGTSVAAPMVAGLLALLLQCFKDSFPSGTPPNVIANVVSKFHEIKFVRKFFASDYLCNSQRLVHVDKFFKQLRQQRHGVPVDEHFAVEIIKEFYPHFNPYTPEPTTVSTPFSQLPTISPPAPQLPTISPPAPQLPTVSTPAPQLPTVSAPAPQLPTVSAPAPQLPTISPLAPQLAEAFSLLLPFASEWKTIALLLSIPHNRIQVIEQENIVKSLRTILVEWLNQTNPQPSWNTLAEVMDCYNSEKAQEIREKYLQQQPESVSMEH